MNLKEIDFFNPMIVVVAILAFLVMGYIGSFNYRFEDPLKPEVILTILFSCLIFTIGAIAVKYKIEISETKEVDFLSEKILVILVLIALVLQGLNLVLIGGIPLFNSVLKSNATTNIWRIAYPLFLIMLNILLAKYYDRKYLILVVLGALIFGLNGYRTSVLGILGSTFITLYYLDKISKKLGIIFIAIMAAGIHVAAVSYVNQNSGCEVFNLGTGTGYSVLDMVNTFAAVNEVAVPYQITDRRPGDLATCYADPAKSAQKLGWKAEKTLADMCRDSWRWQKNNPMGYNKEG